MTDQDTAAFNTRIKAMCAFVEERCAEDETAAKAAKAGQWSVDHSFSHGWRVLDGPDWQAATLVAWTPGPMGSYGQTESRATGDHIVRHQPARVLREIAAKRARVAALLAYARKADEVAANPDRFGDGNRGEILGMLMAHMHAVSVDAEIWADHPGYDPSWRVGP